MARSSNKTARGAIKTTTWAIGRHAARAIGARLARLIVYLRFASRRADARGLVSYSDSATGLQEDPAGATCGPAASPRMERCRDPLAEARAAWPGTRSGGRRGRGSRRRLPASTDD